MSNLIAGFPNVQLVTTAQHAARAIAGQDGNVIEMSRNLRVDGGAGEYCGIAARARCGLFAEAVFDVARFHCVLALEPHIGDCMREGTKPHAIDFSETHQYVEIMDPP